KASEIDPENHETLSKLALPGYRTRVERGIRIRVAALDWNCPQHITPRYTEEQVAQVVEKLTTRVAELEAQLAQ
ncbi:MAG: pyridoxamine 5-phosphate oxidase, partial [Dinoroseobacter sp.]|nr:pyridoxamine 5-phosphate oxidase [Dinoroseobacter sp.]